MVTEIARPAIASRFGGSEPPLGASRLILKDVVWLVDTQSTHQQRFSASSCLNT